MVKMKSKNAGTTIEFAYGIFAAIIVLFVAFGVVFNNVSKMVSSSNFNNMTKNQSSEKTVFNSYGSNNNNNTIVTVSSAPAVAATTTSASGSGSINSTGSTTPSSTTSTTTPVSTPVISPVSAPNASSHGPIETAGISGNRIGTGGFGGTVPRR